MPIRKYSSLRLLGNIAIFPWLAMSLLFLIAECSYAESFEISGISASCPGCINYQDGRCVVPIEGTPTIVPCTKALDYLVIQASRGNSGVAISSSDLKRYLLISRRKPEISLLVLEKLSQEKGFEDFVIKNLGRSLEWYSISIRELMLSGKFAGFKRIQRAIFEEPEDGSAVRTELRIISALINDDISLRDVSFQLGYSNSIYELERLKIWTTTADLLEHSWAKSFRQVHQLLDICSAIEQSKAFPSACSAREINQIGEPFAEFLNKYVLISLSEQSVREHLKPMEILERFARTDYQKHHNPTIHTIITEALSELSLGSVGLGEQRLLDDENKFLLTFLAENDPHISDLYSDLLLKVSIGYWEEREYGKALEAVQVSFSIDDESIPARARILKFFKASPHSLQERDQNKLDMLYSRESYWQDTAIVVAVIVFILALVGFVFRKRLGSLKEPFVANAKIFTELSFSERYELKDTLSSFGLTASANAEELGKAYRTRAKSLHPDSQTGNIDEFNALTSKYQRARSLMQKATHQPTT